MQRLETADTPAAWNLAAGRWLRGVGVATGWAAVILLLACLNWVGWSYEYQLSETSEPPEDVEREAARARAIAWSVGVPIVIGLAAAAIALFVAAWPIRRVGWKRLEEDEAWLREREEHYLKLRRDAASK